MSEKVDRIKGITQEVLECIHSGATDMDALALALGHAKKVISHATQRLKRRGFITAETPGKYSVTEEGLRWITSGVSIKPGQSLKKRRKTRGLRARAWWVLRARGAASLVDLLHTLAGPNAAATANNLGKYLKALHWSGFLRPQERRQHTGTSGTIGYIRYTLVRDNGRLAPVERRKGKEVFDPNTNEVFPIVKPGSDTEGGGHAE